MAANIVTLHNKKVCVLSLEGRPKGQQWNAWWLNTDETKSVTVAAKAYKKQKWEQRLCSLSQTFHLLIFECFTKDRQVWHASFPRHVTSTKMSCELSKVTSCSTLNWELNSAFPWSPVYLSLFEAWFRRLYLWIWTTREEFAGIRKMKWELKPRKPGAENPVVIWLKEMTDVQGIKGWQFLSWISVQCFSISLAFSSWKRRLCVTMNDSEVQGSCVSLAAVGR